MDKIKLSSIGMIKFLHEIKWVVVVVVVLVAVTSSAAAEPPPAVSHPRRTGLKINAPMAIVIAFLLSTLLLICLFFFYFSHCADLQLALASTIVSRDERRSAQLAAACGLDPAVIATFTTFTYSTVKEMKLGKHVLECAVCLIEFSDHEALRLLPECNHVFHRDCIDQWLALRVTCPVCRASLIPKPTQSSPDKCCGPTKDHVSLELSDLKHAKKLSRFHSMGHLMAERKTEDVERYTLRLSDEALNVLKNIAISPSTSPDLSKLKESGMKMSLKSASANFVRGSDYFNYERFGQERGHGERNLTITRSFNSRVGDSDFVEDDTLTSSQRFMMFVKSPLRHMFHISNKDDERLTDKLSTVNQV